MTRTKAVNNAPTNNCYSFWLVETYILSTSALSERLSLRHTRQVEEVGLLVKLIKHRTGLVLDLIRSEDSDAIARKLLRECCSAMMVFKRRYSRSDY
jgi:hypothetical protein